MATELQRQGSTGVTTQEPDEFAALLKQSFKPRNERAASEVESAVATLVTTGAGRYHAAQGRRPRHARRDDRRDRQAVVRSGQRDPARSGVPADRERLARPELPRHELRDGREPQDQRHERRQARVAQQPAPLSRRALGPVAAVQAGLRAGIRHARRPADRRDGLRLRVHARADRRAADARAVQDRRQRAHAAVRGRRPDPDGHGQLDRADEPARPQQAVRHARLCGVEVAARRRGLALCRPVHAARAVAPALRREVGSRSRSSPSRRRPTATPERTMRG